MIAGNDTTICTGESAQLNSTGGMNYSWSPTNGLSNPDISNPLATPIFTTTYILISSIGSCSGTDAITITVKLQPIINAGPDQTVCEGDSVQISALGGTSYSWIPTETLTNPQSAMPFAFPSSTTIYIVEGTDSASCNKIVTDSLIVTVIPKPDIVISGDTTIILGTCTELSITGGGTYQWLPTTGLDNPNDSTPTACPITSTEYHVLISTSQGCVYEDSVLILVNSEPLIMFPSAFSPNDDGKNDFFRPLIVGLASIDEFLIYDRWGTVIFSVFNFSITGIGGVPVDLSYSWDGTYKNIKQPVGVYIYYLKGKDSVTDNSIERQGNFTLVR